MNHKIKIILIISIILLFLALYTLFYKTRENYYSSYSKNSVVDGNVTQNGNSYINYLTTVNNSYDGNTYVTGNTYVDGKHGNYLIDGNAFVTQVTNHKQYSYNKDLDVTFHEDVNSLLNSLSNYNMRSNTIITFDASGKQILIPKSVGGNGLYYEPGSFKYGASNYVPNYEESIYLSKLRF
jgi:hypothetical protein